MLHQQKPSGDELKLLTGWSTLFDIRKKIYQLKRTFIFGSEMSGEKCFHIFVEHSEAQQFLFSA